LRQSFHLIDKTIALVALVAVVALGYVTVYLLLKRTMNRSIEKLRGLVPVAEFWTKGFVNIRRTNVRP